MIETVEFELEWGGSFKPPLPKTYSCPRAAFLNVQIAPILINLQPDSVDSANVWYAFAVFGSGSPPRFGTWPPEPRQAITGETVAEVKKEHKEQETTGYGPFFPRSISLSRSFDAMRFFMQVNPISVANAAWQIRLEWGGADDSGVSSNITNYSPVGG